MEALAPIRETLSEPGNLCWLGRLLDAGTCSSRRQVALEACERFGFHDARGRPRLSSCSAALAGLESAGCISLPTRQTGCGARGRPRGLDGAVPLPAGVADRVDRVEGLHLCRVSEDRHHRIWNELMAREHPAGSVFHAGAQVRYLIGSHHGWLGGLGFSSSAHALKARDQWIGWDAGHPPRHLVVNLSRFLIRPEVHCRNLASWALGRALDRLRDDFMAHYGYRPVLAETFVNPEQYTGHSLLAAGWTRVGETAGRGRFSQPGASVPVRDIWCRPLVPEWRDALGVQPRVVAGRDCGEGLDRQHWAGNEFGGAPLGDRRLSRRVVKSAHLMAESPGASFAAAAQGDAAAIAGHCRMLEQPPESPVTAENLLAVHRGRTQERMAAQSTVLLVQDGTDLNFATHPKCRGLGIVGKNRNGEGTLGLHLHSTLAVAGNGIPLGLTRLEFDAPQPAAAGTSGEGKSGRWLRGLEDASRMARDIPEVQCISVMDREADMYGLFELREQLGNLDLVVRAKHDRSLGAGSPSLFENIRRAPVQARLEIEVERSSARRAARGQKAKPLREARLVQAGLRWQRVTLYRNPASKRSPSLELTLLHVHEPTAPADGSDPLEWLLLTSLPVANRDDAVRILDCYRLRWRIEDWHRVLKSGCRAEFLNLEAAERLERAVTIKAVIAWRLFAMAVMGRETPELPPEVLFSGTEIRVLEHVARDRGRPPPDSLGSAMLTMAMLGGYMNRSRDGPPGYKIIWTGHATLGSYCQAYEMMERLAPGITSGLTPERFYPELRPDRTCG